jgi:AcrR family transcriptional regulator
VQPLSRDRVLREALALLDQYGLGKLSIRQIALRLGVTPMSLYNHFANKDELFDALHEAALLEITTPTIPRRISWRQLAMRMATTLRQVLRAHPQALPLFATRPVRSPVLLRAADELLQRLLADGFRVQQALFLLDCVGDFTVGHALSEFGNSPAAAPDRDGKDLLAKRAALLKAGLHGLVRVTEEAVPHDYDAEFACGLTALLDGFERLRRRARRPG